GDAEVGLLPVGPHRLVHEADRPRAAAEQPDRAVEDALEERPQGELGAEVLDHGRQRRRVLACTGPRGTASRSPGFAGLHRAALVRVGDRSGQMYGNHPRRGGRTASRQSTASITSDALMITVTSLPSARPSSRTDSTVIAETRRGPCP